MRQIHYHSVEIESLADVMSSPRVSRVRLPIERPRRLTDLPFIQIIKRVSGVPRDAAFSNFRPPSRHSRKQPFVRPSPLIVFAYLPSLLVPKNLKRQVRLTLQAVHVVHESGNRVRYGFVVGR